MAWQARFYWVVKSLHDPLDGRALDRYPVIGCSPFGWLLRMGSRSSELRGPTVLAQNSQGSQMVPHPQPATTDFRGVHSSGVITMGMILQDWNLEKKMHHIRSAYH